MEPWAQGIRARVTALVESEHPGPCRAVSVAPIDLSDDGFHDDECRSPLRPDTRELDPEAPIVRSVGPDEPVFVAARNWCRNARSSSWSLARERAK